MFTASLSEPLDVAEWLDYRQRSAGKELLSWIFELKNKTH